MTVTFVDGVTFVLMKKPQLHQLWLSSPISGPSRFDWDGASGAWLQSTGSERHSLLALLSNEFTTLASRHGAGGSFLLTDSAFLKRLEQ